jgi:hypothetical protein
MSAGIRSGVNWMRWNAEVQRLGQRRDEQRLGQAGHADEQAVAAGEQRGQQVLDDLALADDALLDLGAQLGGGRGRCRRPRAGRRRS